jgi:hypothetical protein
VARTARRTQNGGGSRGGRHLGERGVKLALLLLQLLAPRLAELLVLKLSGGLVVCRVVGGAPLWQSFW